MQNGTDSLTSMPNRKTSDGFTISALVAEGSAEQLELLECDDRPCENPGTDLFTEAA